MLLVEPFVTFQPAGTDWVLLDDQVSMRVYEHVAGLQVAGSNENESTVHIAQTRLVDFSSCAGEMGCTCQCLHLGWNSQRGGSTVAISVTGKY